MTRRKEQNVQQNTTQKANDLETRIYEKAGIKCFKCVNTSQTTINTRPAERESILGHLWERFGDTEGVIRSLKSKDK